MAKTNKEIVDCLENEAVIKAWDEGKDDSDLIATRCEDCRFRNWVYWPKQDEVCCNKSGLIMKRDDFCSYGVRYNKKMNKEIANILEELTDDYPCDNLTRCKDCAHHEKYPDDKWVYCIIYDTLKKHDGFCDQGKLKEEN